MNGRKATTNLVLSPLFLVLVIGTSPVDAKEAKQKNDGKKIAAVSVSLPDTVEQPQKKQKPTKAKKSKVTKNVPVSMNHKNLAALSDDEVTRIRLIKRYEGVENPRTDWANGLRTLNWHYTDSVGE